MRLHSGEATAQEIDLHQGGVNIAATTSAPAPTDVRNVEQSRPSHKYSKGHYGFSFRRQYNDLVTRNLHSLEYASPKTPLRRYPWDSNRIVVLLVAIITPGILALLWMLEFALEPPPPYSGYVLDDETRVFVAVVMLNFAILWLIALGCLLAQGFRLRRLR